MSLPGLSVPCPPQVCLLPGLGGNLAKGVADTAATSVMTALSSWVVGGAVWLVQHAIGLIGPATQVDLGASWFRRQEGVMVGVAALLVGPLLAAATIGAVIRQDGRRLGRIFGVGLPVAIVGGATVVVVTQLALGVVDQLCALVSPGDGYKPFLRLGGAISQHEIPMFVQFVLASLVVVAAIVLWMEMVLRASVVYIAVFFLPIGLAAFVWPATAHITKRFVEVLVAVAGSKFVIVATLSLGASLVEQSHVGIDAAVTGVAILLLAAFAPFSVLRLVPVVEAAATAHLEGLSRRPARAAFSAGTGAGHRAAGVLGQLAQGGDAAAGVLPVGIAERVGDWSVPPGASDGTAATSWTGASSAGSPGPASVAGGGVDVAPPGGTASAGGASASSPLSTGTASARGTAAAASSPVSTGTASARGTAAAAPPSTAFIHGVAADPARPVPMPPAAVRPGVIAEEPDGWSDEA